MNTLTDLDVRTKAEAVLGLLDKLEHGLTEAINPDILALENLSLGPRGWTELIHSPQAFELWQHQHEISSDAPATVHHLAIMHHARAMERENGAEPDQADADWRQALAHWHTLHTSDAFWDGLAGKACAGAPNRKAVDELRSQLPRLLLAIHFHLVIHPEARRRNPTRGASHRALAENSPFGKPAADEARDAVYGTVTTQVPNHLWKDGPEEEGSVQGALAIIEDYLAVDSEYLPALKDALHLHVKIQNARSRVWDEAGKGSSERRAILQKIRSDYGAWRPRCERLFNMIEHLEISLREKLAQWFSILASMFRETDGATDECIACLEGCSRITPDDAKRRSTQISILVVKSESALSKGRKSEAIALFNELKSLDISPDLRAQIDQILPRLGG